MRNRHGLVLSSEFRGLAVFQWGFSPNGYPTSHHIHWPSDLYDPRKSRDERASELSKKFRAHPLAQVGITERDHRGMHNRRYRIYEGGPFQGVPIPPDETMEAFLHEAESQSTKELRKLLDGAPRRVVVGAYDNFLERVAERVITTAQLSEKIDLIFAEIPTPELERV